MMLDIPEIGFRPSTKKHNVDLIILCDWIESSVMFVDERLSQSDVMDMLCDMHVYQQKDFAAERVEDAWSELRRRQLWIAQGFPVSIQKRHVQRKLLWQQSLAHSFCLAVTCLQYYKPWAHQFGSNYIEQGDLFEVLAKESLEALGWSVHRTGWASGLHMNDFQTIVSSVSDCLGEPYINDALVSLYDMAKEEKLDLVCYKPFVDGRGGKPVYLMQCGSGENWREKLKTPDIDVWAKLITFSSCPQRAFAMPFALQNEEFFITCNRINGMLLDRYRLLSAGKDGQEWMSNDLKARLLAWLEPRIKTLPTDAA
jgi:hypothetical protein